LTRRGNHPNILAHWKQHGPQGRNLTPQGVTIKIRNLITGTLAIGLLMAAAWGAVPFGANAQDDDEPEGLLSFEDFECPDECAINADVCCAILDPIIIEVEK